MPILLMIGRMVVTVAMNKSRVVGYHVHQQPRVWFRMNESTES